MGAKRGDAQRGVPEQEQDECDEAAFEQPDGEGTSAGEHAVIAADVPEERAGGGENGDRQQPERPRRQQDELALMEDAGRIFEQDFEHESTSETDRDRYRDALEQVGVTDSFKLAGNSTGARPSLVPKNSTPGSAPGVDWFDMRDMLRTLLIGVFLASVALAKTFTLEQVLSAPFPYELTAAPGGGKVAWLLNERGARNVWMASAPDFKGVRLTSYTQDDGQDVGQLRWTPDAKAVVYVRGGDLEFLGRPDPNPAADPAGVDQAIWIATPGEAPRKIAVGHSPLVSPKGDRIAYLVGGRSGLIHLRVAQPRLCSARDPVSRRERSAGRRTAASSPLSAIAPITASSRCTILRRKR